MFIKEVNYGVKKQKRITVQVMTTLKYLNKADMVQ